MDIDIYEATMLGYTKVLGLKYHFILQQAGGLI